MYDDLAYILVLLQEMAQGYNRGTYYARVDKVLLKYHVADNIIFNWKTGRLGIGGLIAILESMLINEH